MMEASRIVLRGVITCRSDAQIIRYPDRYVDERGAEMWNRVIEWMKDYEKRQ